MLACQAAVSQPQGPGTEALKANQFSRVTKPPVQDVSRESYFGTVPEAGSRDSSRVGFHRSTFPWLEGGCLLRMASLWFACVCAVASVVSDSPQPRGL